METQKIENIIETSSQETEIPAGFKLIPTHQSFASIKEKGYVRKDFKYWDKQFHPAWATPKDPLEQK